VKVGAASQRREVAGALTAQVQNRSPKDLRFCFRSLLHLLEGNGKQKGGNNHDREADQRVHLADSEIKRMADTG
jgi:hypothetical protein